MLPNIDRPNTSRTRGTADDDFGEALVKTPGKDWPQMLTGNRLLRLWQTARYRHLMRDILLGRPEAGLELDQLLGGKTAAAAVTLVRLGELNQAATPLAREMLDCVLMSQGRAGDWRDPAGRLCPMLTALCLRALMTLPGVNALVPTTLGMREMAFDRPTVPDTARAILRGLGSLRETQDGEGGWESEIASRELVTGFVLLQLGRRAAFRHAVNFEAAYHVGDGASLPAAERALWASLERRSGMAAAGRGGRARLAGNAAPARWTVNRAGVGLQAKLGFGPLTSAA